MAAGGVFRGRNKSCTIFKAKLVVFNEKKSQLFKLGIFYGTNNPKYRTLFGCDLVERRSWGARFRGTRGVCFKWCITIIHVQDNLLFESYRLWREE